MKSEVNDFLIEGETIDEPWPQALSWTIAITLGITISKLKLEVATRVKFARFHVSPAGIISDPSQFKAIIDFPRPGNVMALCEFIGLINQLNIFALEGMMKMNPFRSLLKKGAAFQWLPDH